MRHPIQIVSAAVLLLGSFASAALAAPPTPEERYEAIIQSVRRDPLVTQYRKEPALRMPERSDIDADVANLDKLENAVKSTCSNPGLNDINKRKEIISHVRSAILQTPLNRSKPYNHNTIPIPVDTRSFISIAIYGKTLNCDHPTDILHSLSAFTSGSIELTDYGLSNNRSTIDADSWIVSSARSNYGPAQAILGAVGIFYDESMGISTEMIQAANFSQDKGPRSDRWATGMAWYALASLNGYVGAKKTLIEKILPVTEPEMDSWAIKIASNIAKGNLKEWELTQRSIADARKYYDSLIPEISMNNISEMDPELALEFGDKQMREIWELTNKLNTTQNPYWRENDKIRAKCVPSIRNVSVDTPTPIRLKRYKEIWESCRDSFLTFIDGKQDEIRKLAYR